MANTKIQLTKKYHIIYKTTNSVNKNIYIGAHSTDNLDDGYYGSGYNLLEAIKKYGKQNFRRDILHIFNDPVKMFEKEKELVNADFLKRRDVYNMVEGGYGGFNKGSKGLRHMNNPVTKSKIAVSPAAIEKMLAEGYILGRGSSSTTNRCWIHNKTQKKMVEKTEIEKYVNQGWVVGLPKSPTKNKIWIYNSVLEKYSLCDKSELPEKINNGWIKKKWSPYKKDKPAVWITDGKENLRITLDDFDDYKNKGWKLGMIQNHSKT
jgi:hypothetical protein